MDGQYERSKRSKVNGKMGQRVKIGRFLKVNGLNGPKAKTLAVEMARELTGYGLFESGRTFRILYEIGRSKIKKIQISKD